MLTSVCFNANKDDFERRSALFKGDLLVYAGTQSTNALADYATKMIVQCLGENPTQAQFSMPVEEFVSFITPLKTAFTNSPTTTELVQALLESYGCDLTQTYFDVPRLRIVTHGGYLSAGVGYAYKAHRDNWYGSPECQINWWMPVYDVTPERTMGIFPQWWDKPIKNTSAEFDYDEWCDSGRKEAVKQIKADTRKHPLPLESLEDADELRMGFNRGEMLLFSTTHLHQTAPNNSGQTRFSLDFRTVHRDDLESGRAAPNLDNQATGTTLIDFRRASDLTALPDDLIQRYRRKK